MEEKNIWKKTIDIKFDVDKEILRRTSIFESKARFGVSQDKYEETIKKIEKEEKIVKKNEMEESKKNYKKDLIHSIRYLLFAKQILKKGKIYKYNSANKYFYKIMNIDQEKEKEISIFKNFAEIQNNLIQKINFLAGDSSQFFNLYSTDSYSADISLHRDWKNGFLEKIKCKKKNLFTQKKIYPKNFFFFQLQKLLNEENETSLSEMKEKYKFSVTRNEKFENLFMFSIYDCNFQFFGLFNSLQLEFSSLILDFNDSFNPVSIQLPPRHSPHYFQLGNFDENCFFDDVYEYINDFSCILYYYGGMWHLSSNYDANDPSNILGTFFFIFNYFFLIFNFFFKFCIILFLFDFHFYIFIFS